MLAAAGGFLVVPIAGSLTAAVCGSPTAGIVADGLAAGVTLDRARKTSGPESAAMWGGFVGSLFGMFGLWMVSRFVSATTTIRETHNGQLPPASPGPAPLGTAPQWNAFPPQASAVPLMTGVRYRAAIDLPFGVGALATDERVRAKAVEMGFSDVQIVDEPAWSDPFGRVGDADLFVEATYSGAPRWLERNDRIVAAWAFV